MRKRFAFLLVSVLMMLSMTVPVSASERNETKVDFTKKEIMDTACEVFPEYADTIQKSERKNVGMMSEEDYVIFSETRMTDDKNLVAYTEYASGLFDIVYSWGRNPIGSTSAGGATIYEENFWMQPSWSDQSLIVSGVKYTIHSSGYDIINSRGSLGGYNLGGLYGSYKATEDVSGAAYSEYSASFAISHPVYGETTSTGRLRITVGNNNVSISTYKVM